MDPDDLPMQRAARTGERVDRSECEIRFNDRGSIFIAGHCIPIKDGNGEVCGSLGAFVDVTEQRQLLDRTDLLAREMVHRVKNTLSLVQSLAHNTLRDLVEPAEFSKFEGRLMSIANAQNLLAETHVQVDLAALLAAAIAPVTQTLWDRVSLGGPELAIPGDLATPLSMIFHELATNACKYGSLSAGGNIGVNWKVLPQPGAVVSIDWIEGGGPLVRLPTRLGFGTKLIDRLARSLPNGKFSRQYGGTGLRAHVSFRYS